MFVYPVAYNYTSTWCHQCNYKAVRLSNSQLLSNCFLQSVKVLSAAHVTHVETVWETLDSSHGIAVCHWLNCGIAWFHLVWCYIGGTIFLSITCKVHPPPPSHYSTLHNWSYFRTSSISGCLHLTVTQCLYKPVSYPTPAHSCFCCYQWKILNYIKGYIICFSYLFLPRQRE